jgi:hypothetical protein
VMVSLEVVSGTRGAALTRLLLTLVCWPAITFICVLFPLVHFVSVFIPLYLTWVFVVDAVTLGRGLFRDVRYAERPRFWWFFGIGLALFMMWTFLQFTPVGRRIIGHSDSETPHFGK